MNIIIFSANLPLACQELYANVACAESIDLDWLPTTGQLRLTDAIHYSINTEGKILYNKLKEKATKFGTKSNTHETYLQVTLGSYCGNSPGVPYVLEIWPYKHYNPIHSHGNGTHKNGFSKSQQVPLDFSSDLTLILSEAAFI